MNTQRHTVLYLTWLRGPSTLYIDSDLCDPGCDVTEVMHNAGFVVQEQVRNIGAAIRVPLAWTELMCYAGLSGQEHIVSTAIRVPLAWNQHLNIYLIL